MKKIMIISNVSNALDFRRELIYALTKKYKVAIVCEDERYIPQYKEMGCEHIKSRSSQYGKNPIQEMTTIVDYKRIIKQWQPDVVVTYTIKPNIYAGIACASLGVPYIANITGLSEAIISGGMLRVILLFLYRFGLRKAKRVVFQNNSTRELFSRKKIISNNAVTVAGSGVNLEEHPFEKYPPDNGRLLFLTMGRIIKAKGIEELLGAAKRIKKQYPEVTFKLLGTIYENYDDVIAKAVEQGLIEFEGQQSDVQPYLKSSHATIHASYHEGMSNTLLETASAGRPIIASAIPGCQEAFEEGVSGIGFLPKNEDDLVRAIEQFIKLPYTTKEAMGVAGRKKMEREFDRKKVTQTHLDIIESIIGG